MSSKAFLYLGKSYIDWSSGNPGQNGIECILSKHRNYSRTNEKLVSSEQERRNKIRMAPNIQYSQ